MVFSVQSRHRLTYIREAVFGETPASPSMKELRHSGCNLSLNRKTIESDEIRDDRHMGHFLPGEKSVSGDINLEFSYGGCDDLLAATFYGNWSENILKTGTSEQSLTVERGFTDIDQYQVFTGCVPDEMRLSIQPGSLISGVVSLKGKSMKLSETPLDTVPEPANDNAPMDSFQGFLREGGNLLAVAAGLDIKLENGVAAAFTLGEDTARQFSSGRSRVSGELTAYFENSALIRKFINGVSSSLEIEMVGEGGRYKLLLPNVLYTGAEMPVRGEEAVVITLPFAALYDETEQTNIQITRIAA